MRTVFQAFMPVVSVAREFSVVAAVKLFRAPLRRLEQIAQRRHRSVVQIRRAQPDAVQRLVSVAEGFAEVRESLFAVAGVEKILVHAEVERVTIEPPAVCFDLFDRRDPSDILAAEVLAAPPVAARAVLRIERRASGRERLIDRVWIGRRLGCEQPVFDSLDVFAVERRRRSAGAESGAAVALPHGVIIAVPMELHLALLALALIPD